MNKFIYCTLDTETVGGAVNPTGMYNAGAVFYDNTGRIYAKVSMLVMEHYDLIKNDNYAKRNFNLYAEMLSNGSITAVASEEDAYNIILNLCHFYNVRYVSAYNSGFDFTKTIFRKLINEFEFIDLYLMALQTITHKNSYIKFCQKYNLLSGSKKCYSTTAQTVYAYLTNDPNYAEEHTALSDSEIEMQIFLACYRMHKKFTRNQHQFDCKINKCFPRVKKIEKI